jgi:hypothetical protein
VNDALALHRAGVQLISLREPWLDTGGPVRDLLLAIFSWVAEQERARFVERTRAGMQRAAKYGTKSGLPIGRATADGSSDSKAQAQPSGPQTAPSPTAAFDFVAHARVRTSRRTSALCAPETP